MKNNNSQPPLATRNSEKQDYVDVTEIAGDEVSREQIDRACRRYYWAADFCEGKDVLEVACGAGFGLGYLQKKAKSLVAGDYSAAVLSYARKYYGERIALKVFDAQNMPFRDNSFDVIIIFEALYYLPDPEAFARECQRVLRKGGYVLVSNANKDLYDFSPSPHAFTYHGVRELEALFRKHGFSTRFWGDTPVGSISLKQRLLRPIKKLVVSAGLMPRTMAGKKLLKRLIFGRLEPMPNEITADMAEPVPPDEIAPDKPNTTHKVIFCAARLKA